MFCVKRQDRCLLQENTKNLHEQKFQSSLFFHSLLQKIHSPWGEPFTQVRSTALHKQEIWDAIWTRWLEGMAVISFANIFILKQSHAHHFVNSLSLFSPTCMSHLFICAFFNSSSMPCPPSAVLCELLLRIWFNILMYPCLQLLSVFGLSCLDLWFIIVLGYSSFYWFILLPKSEYPSSILLSQVWLLAFFVSIL